MPDELKERNILKLILAVKLVCVTLDGGSPLPSPLERYFGRPGDSSFGQYAYTTYLSSITVGILSILLLVK
jgi:hypothetical protein